MKFSTRKFFFLLMFLLLSTNLFGYKLKIGTELSMNTMPETGSHFLPNYGAVISANLGHFELSLSTGKFFSLVSDHYFLKDGAYISFDPGVLIQLYQKESFEIVLTLPIKVSYYDYDFWDGDGYTSRVKVILFGTKPKVSFEWTLPNNVGIFYFVAVSYSRVVADFSYIDTDWSDAPDYDDYLYVHMGSGISYKF